MKKVLLLVLFVSLVISCKKDEVVPEPKSDYTVMVYASGGGNLDSFLQRYIGDISEIKRGEKINFAGLIKFSKNIQENSKIPDSMKGTLYIDNACQTSRYAGSDFKMYEPQNITNFINKVAKDYPAKKYILILWNHGLPISELDTPLSKAVLEDDNTHSVITPYQLEAGIKASNIKKFDLIYADLCMNNNIEIDYQLSTVTDYYMGSANPGIAGASDYKLFFDCLNTKSSLEEAMKAYIPALTTGKWLEKNILKWSIDISLLDLRKIGPVISNFKKVSSRYIELYKTANAETITRLEKIQRSGDERVFPMILDSTPGKYYVWPKDGNFYYYDNQLPIGFIQKEQDGTIIYPNVHKDLYTCTDLYASFNKLSECFNDSSFNESLKQFKAAIDAMVLCKGECEAPEWFGYRALISLKWVAKKRFDGYLFEEEKVLFSSPLRLSYPFSRFDQETKWSTYFDLYQSDYPYYTPTSLSDFDL